MFCALFKTIRCSQVSPISISKNENYELCILAGFSIMTGKKSSSHLSGEKKKIQSSVCWVRGSGDYDRKKKDTVLCLAGCAVVVRISGDNDRKKKVPVVCLAGCAVVSVFGSGDYDR